MKRPLLLVSLFLGVALVFGLAPAATAFEVCAGVGDSAFDGNVVFVGTPIGEGRPSEANPVSIRIDEVVEPGTDVRVGGDYQLWNIDEIGRDVSGFECFQSDTSFERGHRYVIGIIGDEWRAERAPIVSANVAFGIAGLLAVGSGGLWIARRRQRTADG